MITVSELLEITFRMGLPVFTLAAIVQFIFLSKKFSLKWFFSLLIVGVTFFNRRRDDNCALVVGGLVEYPFAAVVVHDF